ncbi:MAG: glycosyltransferase family 2 protein [Phycisphaeraceae bacterium]|nr:glycosyltransferase family 2 protein [Phycisphaeraceae bacterium]
MKWAACYDIILATRNRSDVLALSLPLLLAQTRPARKLIIVDGSDDPQPVRERVDSLHPPAGLQVIRLHAPPGLPAQRNLGLQHSDADVVMFPDDDTLLHPDAAERVMAVYEADTRQQIAGVAFEETYDPPPAVCDQVGGQHKPLRDRLIYRLSPWRARTENVICPSPFTLLGHRGNKSRMQSGKSLPAGVKLIPFMLGFRMTFRRPIIARHGFDESMTGYALYEDMNASFAAQRDGVLVEAADALAYHHRVVGSRASPRRTGAILALNIMYVTCRYTAVDDPLRQSIKPYLRLRAWQYRMRRRNDFGQERYEAFMDAMDWLDIMVAATPDILVDVYQMAMDYVLNK